MTVLHIDNTPPRKPEDAGKTDGEIWHEKMLAMMRSHFPWRATPDAGRWYLYDNMGACLAKFNLDSGHGSRLAAAAPAMLGTLETVERELPQGAEFDSLRSLVRSAIYTALRTNS